MSEQSGRDPNREGALDRLQEAASRGEVRESISCEEARDGWFRMARRMYVEGDPEPDVPLDFEVGVHITQCPMSACQALATAYEKLLRPSQPEDSERLVVALEELRMRVDATDN